MKKFILALAAIAMSCGVYAQNKVTIDPDELANGGWDATYDKSTNQITLTGGYGAKSKWFGNADWSSYSTLTVELGDCTFKGDSWVQVLIQYAAKDSNEKSYSSVKSVSSDNSFIVVDLNPSYKGEVAQLSVQGKTEGDVLTVKDIFLTESIVYETTGKTLPMDQYGQILASEFSGYSDNAKIVFTYNTTGELTKVVDGELTDITNWGTGALKSIGLDNSDQQQKLCDIPLKKVGENTFSYSLFQIKELLNMPKANEWNCQGLCWEMYTQGNAVSTRVSVVIYEVAGLSPIKVIEMDGKEVISSEIYNINGQKVDTLVKGINIIKTTYSDGTTKAVKVMR